MIEIRGLTVAYGRTLAIDRVDLAVEGGLNGLFGPNGAGKSTLLRVIAGLERPTAGTIEFGSLRGMGAEERRRRLSYAGHASGLYGHLTLRENMALLSTLYEAPPARGDELIDALGLRDHAHKAARDLSAGLKRRAAVARALLHDPEILLLDEPYANVDDEASDAISSAIRAWWRPGRCGIVATHGAKKVRAYAHSGIVLQRGRVARAGRYTDAGFTAT